MKTLLVDAGHGIIYPRIKDGSSLQEAVPANAGVLPRSIQEANYFFLDYRFDDIVIDCIARKYNMTYQNYIELEPDDEHILLGSSNCKQALKNQDDAYFQKIKARLTKEKIVLKSIIGIYLPQVYDFEDSKQEFLLFTKERFYFKPANQPVSSYAYHKIFFSEDGVGILPGAEKNKVRTYLLQVPLPDVVLDFAREFMLLRCAKLHDVLLQHPVSRLSVEHRMMYLDFMTSVSAGEGRLTAEKLIYLENMARTMHLSDSALINGLKKAEKNGGKENVIRKSFAVLQKNMLEQALHWILYQDILYLTVEQDGDMSKSLLLKELKKDTFAGSEFVRTYCDYLLAQQEAHKALLRAFVYMDKQQADMEIAYKWYDYLHELVCRNLEIGVKSNG